MWQYFVLFAVITTCAEKNFLKKYNGVEIRLQRTQRAAERVDNVTCTDLCLEELSNYTNGLQTNTTIVINPDGSVFSKIDPEDFENICPIYGRTLPCLKKCKDPEIQKLITGFSGLTYLCIDKYKDIKPNYKCINGALNENPKLDKCVPDCLENVTKATSKNAKNGTEEDCSTLRCIVKCGLRIVREKCKPEAVKMSREFSKIQIDILEKSNDPKHKWVKDCSQFQKELIGDKPLE